MKHIGQSAELFINDQHVGTVHIKTSDNAWHFGQFEPAPGFSPFAPLFGRWSLLMHADEDSDRLTPAASDELRESEIEIDKLHARLRPHNGDPDKRIYQVNIDGDMIDWKE